MNISDLSAGSYGENLISTYFHFHFQEKQANLDQNYYQNICSCAQTGFYNDCRRHSKQYWLPKRDAKGQSSLDYWNNMEGKKQNKNRHFRKLTVQFWIIVHIPGLVPAMRATSPTYQRPINMIWNATMKRTEEKYIVRKSERFMRISTPIDWKLGRWYRDAKQIQATYLQSCNMTIWVVCLTINIELLWSTETEPKNLKLSYEEAWNRKHTSG